MLKFSENALSRASLKAIVGGTEEACSGGYNTLQLCEASCNTWVCMCSKPSSNSDHHDCVGQ